MKFSILQESRKGGREYNQDRVGHRATPESLLLVLADGMGGYSGGERAAEIAVQTLCDTFAAEARPRLADPDSFIWRATRQAHDAIVRKAGETPRTTLVACVVQAGWAHWSFVGDSRLYLIHAGRILARTRDHSPVQQLIDAGRIREEAAASHPARNQLLRSLGGPVAPQPERPASASLEKGDLILLCSDGLWGPLSSRLLLMGFIGKEPARALPELMGLAEARAGAGADNLSALVLQWQEETVIPLRVMNSC